MRQCDLCKKTYYRSNRMRIWTMVNPGHRLGWRKEELKLCIACFTTKQAKQVCVLAQVR